VSITLRLVWTAAMRNREAGKVGRAVLCMPRGQRAACTGVTRPTYKSVQICVNLWTINLIVFWNEKYVRYSFFGWS
jgi:hypothetical protein